MVICKESKIIIEFDGQFHFEQGKLRSEEEYKSGRRNDIEKTKLAVETHKLKMIRIAYPLLKRKKLTPFKEFLSSALDDPKMLVVSHPDMYEWLPIDEYNKRPTFKEFK